MWDLMEVARHTFAAAVGTKNLDLCPVDGSSQKMEALGACPTCDLSRCP